jgi:phosphoglycerate kinase
MAEAVISPGLKGILKIDEFDLKDKRVFLRVDFNVPMEKGKITDDNRIRAALPTIRYALEKGAKLVLGSHLGRPEPQKPRGLFSLEPVAHRLSDLLNIEVILVDEPASDAPKGLLPGLRPGQVLMLENLRFDEGESENSGELAATISSYTDIYINDAFGASHRAHSSIDALPRLVSKKGIGFLIAKEIEFLDSLLHSPAKPYMVILGGSKVSDKIPIIEKLMDLIDVTFIGGAMAYTFLAAQGVAVGGSRVEKDKVNFAGEMIKRIQARGKKIFLPVDHIIVDHLQSRSPKATDGAAIPDGFMAVDIGPKTRELYRKELQKAHTVFWNGPMGIFENPLFSQGTFAIAKALAELKGQAKTVIGGGDSAAAAEASGFAEQMTHISTGGGASLEYLQGDKLPGLEVLRNLRPSVTPTL